MIIIIVDLAMRAKYYNNTMKSGTIILLLDKSEKLEINALIQTSQKMINTKEIKIMKYQHIVNDY